MSEVLGLLDALESIVLESKKVPFTENIIIEEKKIISLLDKIRLTIKSNGKVVRESVDVNNLQIDLTQPSIENMKKNEEPLAMQQATEEAEKIKKGANEYADYVLTSLQLTVSKMYKNLMTLEKNIESGRTIIDKNITDKKENKKIEN